MDRVTPYQVRVADHPLRNDIAVSTSTRLCGTSPIFFRRHTQDTFESLTKRRVRAVADRFCYVEQFSTILLEQSGCLVHSPVLKYSSGVSPSSSLNRKAKAERDIPAAPASVSTVQGFSTLSCIALSASPIFGSRDGAQQSAFTSFGARCYVGTDTLDEQNIRQAVDHYLRAWCRFRHFRCE